MLTQSARVAHLAMLLVFFGAQPSQAQRGFRGPAPDSTIRNIPYDGRLIFARLRYTTGPGGYYYMGLPSWAHGYQKAENNLTRIMQEVSKVKSRIDASNVLAMDDPDLMKFPVAFMTEAGYWVMTDKEAAGLRAYFKKGGFVIFDDFRDDGRNYGGWANFTANMKRVLPDARILDLDATHPIFHSFFEIPSLDIIPQSYGNGRPIFRAIYEDNDPKKRMLAVINFNTDISDFWEFSGQGMYPVSESNEGYKLGVNYLVYALTH
jgi:hypothetical protein